MHFECPALVFNEKDKYVDVDPILCSKCGVCIYVCPKKAIREKKKIITKTRNGESTKETINYHHKRKL